MKIGQVKLKNNIFMAPMAGVTNSAFRKIVRQFDCGLVFTEMVNARGMVDRLKNSWKLMEFSGEERPISLQIFGSDSKVMAEAACLGVDYGYDMIDINMGCPTPKIVKNGEGAFLMRNLPLAQRILESVTGAVEIPVSLKMRKGWQEGEVTALPLAKIAEETGVSFVTIHGRTREQFYRGEADWDIIREIKESVNIPVVGNGDLRSPQDCKRMIEETGCDGIMIGQGALGNPWIFKQVERYLKEGELISPPSQQEVINIVLEHLSLLTDLKGERTAVKEMRKHVSWYIKGIKGSNLLRKKINQCETVQEMEKALQMYYSL